MTTTVIPIEFESVEHPTLCLRFPTWGVDKEGTVYRWQIIDRLLLVGRPERTEKTIEIGDAGRELFRRLEETEKRKAWGEHLSLTWELQKLLAGAVK